MADNIAIEVKDFNAFYGEKQALHNINMKIPNNCIYALIGPSGCGKTTLLRSINRMNDLYNIFHHSGEIIIDDKNIYSSNDRKYVSNLRKSIGMVFQQPNPLPTTILKNLALPIKEHYSVPNEQLKTMCIKNLKKASIYDEVKDRLNKSAVMLSGGQQQRLCIARSLMLEPKIILFDEPCSALDPIATFAIEELLLELSEQYCIVIVTHNLEQAKRISDYTAFFYNGVIIEQGETSKLFTNPETDLLNQYITGRI